MEYDRVAMHILLCSRRGSGLATDDGIGHLCIVGISVPYKMTTGTFGSLLFHLAREQVSAELEQKKRINDERLCFMQ